MSDKNKFVFFAKIKNAFTGTFLPAAGDTKKQRIATMLFSGVLAVYLVLTVFACILFADEARNAERIDEISGIIGEEQTGNYSKEFKQLEKINSDIKYWVTFAAGEINLPVVKTDKLRYSKKHNYDGRFSRYGTLYTDATAKEGENLVIYGNDMADGSMFGSLDNLRNPKNFIESPYLEVITERGSTPYVVFSVMILAEDEKDDNGKGFDITKGNFKNYGEFSKWRDEAEQRSLIKTQTKVQYGDKVVCFVTDAQDFGGALLAVMAFEVNVDTNVNYIEDAAVNPNARYPKIWYDKNGYDYPSHY